MAFSKSSGLSARPSHGRAAPLLKIPSFSFPRGVSFCRRGGFASPFSPYIRVHYVAVAPFRQMRIQDSVQISGGAAAFESPLEFLL